MQIQSPELLNQIAVWRAKSADGTITLEEMRAAIIALRQNRVSAITEAGVAKRAAASKKIVPPAAAADLLDQLKGM